MKNKELIQLLGLEKSLVYFSTSLKADEITLEKILRGRIIKRNYNREPPDRQWESGYIHAVKAEHDIRPPR